MATPFPETAAQLLDKARATPCPYVTYGYAVAKTRALHGDRALAERCLAYWDAHAGGRDATDLALAEGVSAWRVEGTDALEARLTRKNAETGQIQAVEVKDL